MLILHKLQNLSSFVFLHCLIYKVHAAAPLGDSLFILPHAVRFVKNFFQLFSEVSFVLAAPRERFANIPPETTDVNNFFHIFAIIFRLFPGPLNIVVFAGYTTQYANELLSLRPGRCAASASAAEI